MRYIYLLLSLLLFAEYSLGQLGGSYSYAHLQLSPSARVTSLGGSAIVTPGNDINLAYMNPALLNEGMHQELSFSHAFYMAGIQHGYVSYGHHLEKAGITLGGGLLYRTYGSFDRTDPTGLVFGEFNASEYVLNTGLGYREGKLSYGANVKLLYSQLEFYNSLGVALDIGGTYTDTAADFTASVVLRNIGFMIDGFTPGEREPIPFEIQLGVSKRLQYLPLRLGLIVHNMQQADIRYDDPRQEEDDNVFLDEEPEEKTYLADKIFRHVIVNGEFYFGKNFSVRLGYNHLRRQELGFESAKGLAGFSLGAGLRIKTFRIDYGLGLYNRAGSAHHLSIVTNLGDFGRNKLVAKN